MRTKNFLRHLTFVALLLTTGKVTGQATTPGNVAAGPTDFLGWDNTFPANNFPLMVRHDLNQPIEWYTDALQRMLLHRTQTTNLPVIGGGTVAVQQDGFLALSGSPGLLTPTGRGAFTRLHLADIDPTGIGPNFYAQPWGFRTWMRNGVTFTGNRDQAYVGQRYYAEDSTDFVVQWSDNPDKQTQGADRMRFLFTSNNTGAVSGSRSLEGLEFMRMFPVDQNQGWVGVGNFAVPGLLEPEPTERLDLLNRTIRLRDFADPLLYLNTSVDRVLVADPADGRVYWRPASSLPTTVDCDWTISGGLNNQDVWTAVGTSTVCPSYDNFVGVGTAFPRAKLDVRWTGPSSLTDAFAGNFQLDGDSYGKRAGNFHALGVGEVHKGLESLAEGALTEGWNNGNYGLDATADANATGYTENNVAVQGDATVRLDNQVRRNIAFEAITNVVNQAVVQANYGLYSQAYTYGSGGSNYGGYFDAYSPNGVTNGYGVYARSAGATNNWSGYFVGDVQAGASFFPSDANLKTNIAEADEATLLETLDALNVHTYSYDNATYAHMQLPQGPQVGLLAQELEAVLPGLVKDATAPAEYDAEGNEVIAAVDYKAVNLVGLIPYLIAGHQAQQAQLVEMQDRMEQMEQALAACCANPGSGDARMHTGEEEGTTVGDARKLSIAPNPFHEQTTLYYTLEKAGRAQLLVNSSDGKQLRVLHEATQQAGEFQHVWNTTELAPGLYYVTLLLDGEPVVKKAVKVAR